MYEDDGLKIRSIMGRYIDVSDNKLTICNDRKQLSIDLSCFEQQDIQKLIDALQNQHNTGMFKHDGRQHRVNACIQ